MLGRLNWPKTFLKIKICARKYLINTIQMLYQGLVCVNIYINILWRIFIILDMLRACTFYMKRRIVER